jgi:hypothetical protein
MVAVFPDVAGIGIEKRVVTAAIRELDTGVASLGHDGLGLKDWFQGDHRKKQSDERKDRFSVKANPHVKRLQSVPAGGGRLETSILEADDDEWRESMISVFWDACDV